VWLAIDAWLNCYVRKDHGTSTTSPQAFPLELSGEMIGIADCHHIVEHTIICGV
jgi:hypothetical protein